MIFPYFSVPTIKPKNFKLDKKSPFTAETATFVWDSIPADSPDLKGKFDGYVVSIRTPAHNIIIYMYMCLGRESTTSLGKGTLYIP